MFLSNFGTSSVSNFGFVSVANFKLPFQNSILVFSKGSAKMDRYPSEKLVRKIVAIWYVGVKIFLFHLKIMNLIHNLHFKLFLYSHPFRRKMHTNLKLRNEFCLFEFGHLDIYFYLHFMWYRFFFTLKWNCRATWWFFDPLLSLKVLLLVDKC